MEHLYNAYVPSRNEILYADPGGRRPDSVLKAFSLTEQKDRTVVAIPYLDQLCVIGNGGGIAYSTNRPVEGHSKSLYEVALASLDGIREGTLLPAQSTWVSPAAASPDGKFLLLDTENGPVVVDIRTKESWPLHTDTIGTEWNMPSMAWSPDGSFILLDKYATKAYRLAWEGVTAEAIARLMAARK